MGGGGGWQVACNSIPFALASYHLFACFTIRVISGVKEVNLLSVVNPRVQCLASLMGGGGSHKINQ